MADAWGRGVFFAGLNVADGMATPLAQKEYEQMFDTLGGKPAHHTLAMHRARLICALQAAEHNRIIANDPLLTSKDSGGPCSIITKRMTGAF